MDITKNRLRAILDTGANVIMTAKGMDDMSEENNISVFRIAEGMGDMSTGNNISVFRTAKGMVLGIIDMSEGNWVLLM
jgi:hypothetical protein